ncbi:MAG: hypothetical protein LUQ30_02720 [Methanothrix sp.]|nr:hypothetical protein [Methanothrix sp.]
MVDAAGNKLVVDEIKELQYALSRHDLEEFHSGRAVVHHGAVVKASIEPTIILAGHIINGIAVHYGAYESLGVECNCYLQGRSRLVQIEQCQQWAVSHVRDRAVVVAHVHFSGIPAPGIQPPLSRSLAHRGDILGEDGSVVRIQYVHQHLTNLSRSHDHAEVGRLGR